MERKLVVAAFFNCEQFYENGIANSQPAEY
jgi:hypothetical protein